MLALCICYAKNLLNRVPYVYYYIYTYNIQYKENPKLTQLLKLTMIDGLTRVLSGVNRNRTEGGEQDGRVADAGQGPCSNTLAQWRLPFCLREFCVPLAAFQNDGYIFYILLRRQETLKCSENLG